MGNLSVGSRGRRSGSKTGGGGGGDGGSAGGGDGGGDGGAVSSSATLVLSSLDLEISEDEETFFAANF
jgi:hypothetical protein